MSRPVGDVAARGVVEIGESTSSTISGYTFTTVVALTAPTPVAEWQDRGTRLFAVRQDGRLYLKPLGGPPTGLLGDLWLEGATGTTYLRYQGAQGLVTLGAGTVTSVGLSLPGDFTVTGSPVTGSGTLTATWASVGANKLLAGPDGTPGTPGFRTLTHGDFPNGVVNLASLNASGTPGVSTYLCGNGTWAAAVTSVGLSGPAQFSVSGSPVTGSGTLTFAWQNQTANTFMAGPVSGIPGAPGFRALVAADFPALVVPVGSIGATGTPSASTYLRGDATWATFTTGTVTGTGVAGQVAYWSGTSGIQGSTGLTYSGGTLSTSVTAALPFIAFNGSLGGNPATSGTTQTVAGQIARLALSNAALDIGSRTSGNLWLQGNAINNLATTLTLELNPNGGPVVIGADPGGSQVLRVGGDAVMNGIVYSARAAATDPHFEANASGVAAFGFGFNNSGSANAYGVATGRGYIGTPQAFPLDFQMAGVKAGTINSDRTWAIGTDPGGAALCRIGGDLSVGSYLGGNSIILGRTGTVNDYAGVLSLTGTGNGILDIGATKSSVGWGITRFQVNGGSVVVGTAPLAANSYQLSVGSTAFGDSSGLSTAGLGASAVQLLLAGASNRSGMGVLCSDPAPAITYRNFISGGSPATAAATPSGSGVVHSLYGHSGSAWTAARASWQMLTGSLWSGTSNETYHSWSGTPSGSTALAEWMRLQGGSLIIGTDPGGSATLRGAGSVYFTGQFRSGAQVDENIAGTTNGLSVKDSSATCGMAVGQTTSRSVGLLWNYNATPALASASLYTYGYANPIMYGASYHNFTVGSVIIGTDPGGSELLRVGGAGRFAGNLFTAPASGDATVYSARGTGETCALIAGSGVGLVQTSSNHPLWIRTNGVAAISIDTSQHVGVGLSPQAYGQLQVLSAAGFGAPVTSGTAQTYAIARFRGGNATLDIGQYSSGVTWLQGTDTTNLAVNYALTLQPTGGSVIIGTDPGGGQTLRVGGNIYASADIAGVGQVAVNGISGNAVLLGTCTQAAGYAVLRLQNTGASGRSYDFDCSGNTTPYLGAMILFDGTAGALRFSVGPTGGFYIGNSYTDPGQGNLQVQGGVGFFNTAPVARATGFGTPTNLSRVANFPGTGANLSQTGGALADLITYLKATGLLGA